eukprot:GFYU01011725.1.p1 GENE.GFYU01011725.1~~GFYU01011725.1.p1  ORF type:complete len:199 (-),score=48.90 GFYU01011725.1:115-711(-)
MANVRVGTLVIAGPSGAGKGTIIGKLLEKFPDRFGLCVSHTTRAPRPGEEDGVHYHFSEYEKMEAAIQNGEFLEHANVHGNLYGTSFDAIKALQEKGKSPVLDVDVQGVMSIKAKELKPTPVFVFVAPPNMDVLRQRLEKRGTETPETINRRMKRADSELKFMHKDGMFDATITNNDLDNAVADLLALLTLNSLIPSS